MRRKANRVLRTEPQALAFEPFRIEIEVPWEEYGIGLRLSLPTNGVGLLELKFPRTKPRTLKTLTPATQFEANFDSPTCRDYGYNVRVHARTLLSHFLQPRSIVPIVPRAPAQA